MNRRLGIAFVGLLGMISFAHDVIGLRKELSARSSTGLGLVWTWRGSALISKFDGRPQYCRTSRMSSGLVGKAGTMVAWTNSEEQPTELEVRTIPGMLVTRARIKQRGVALLALHEAKRRIAFRSAGVSGKVYWSSFDLNTPVAVADSGNHADWSADGRYLVIGHGTKLTVFDTTQNQAVLELVGRHAEWHPVKLQISFMDKNGALKGADLQGRIWRWPFEREAPQRGIRWSPQGDYVAFLTKEKRGMLSLSSGYAVRVTRTQDGVSMLAHEFGSFGIVSGAFSWIADSKLLESECLH